MSVQAVILIGIQATGKSTFFRERFFRTHVRINLDMLRTRHREELLLGACVTGAISFVVDNTNVTAADRARYIAPARDAGFRIDGFYFESRRSDALARNASRAADERIPERGVLGCAGRLELPSRGEGFDSLQHVRIGPDGTFTTEEWRDEVR
jgi:predicted kinase